MLESACSTRVAPGVRRLLGHFLFRFIVLRKLRRATVGRDEDCTTHVHRASSQREINPLLVGVETLFESFSLLSHLIGAGATRRLATGNRHSDTQ